MVCYLAHHLDRHPQFGKVLETRKDLTAKRRVLAHQHFDLVRLGSLKTFNAVDTSIGEPSNCGGSNVRYLLQLVRAVVPDSGGKAACKLQGMSDCNGILDVYLTVNDAADQTMNMVEYNVLVLLVLSLEFAVLLVDREFHTTKFRLYN